MFALVKFKITGDKVVIIDLFNVFKPITPLESS